MSPHIDWKNPDKHHKFFSWVSAKRAFISDKDKPLEEKWKEVGELASSAEGFNQEVKPATAKKHWEKNIRDQLFKEYDIEVNETNLSEAIVKLEGIENLEDEDPTKSLIRDMVVSFLKQKLQEKKKKDEKEKKNSDLEARSQEVLHVAGADKIKGIASSHPSSSAPVMAASTTPHDDDEEGKAMEEKENEKEGRGKRKRTKELSNSSDANQVLVDLTKLGEKENELLDLQIKEKKEDLEDKLKAREVNHSMHKQQLRKLKLENDEKELELEERRQALAERKKKQRCEEVEDEARKEGYDNHDNDDYI